MTAPTKTVKVVKLRLGPKETPDFKPFIVEPDGDRMSDPYAVVGGEGLDPLSSRVPTNKEAIELGDKFRKALPDLMGDRIKNIRDFFLTEIAPVLLASSNGLLDAGEVLKNALGEEAEVQPYFNRLERMLDVALEIRMIHFISGFAGLDAQQKHLLTGLLFNKESDEPGKKKLHEVQPVSNVQRPSKSAEVQLRPVPEDESGRVYTGVRRVRGRAPR